MGCSDSKNKTHFDIEGEYVKRGLQQPWSGEYENQFEKEAFMAINLLRSDPKIFTEQIKQVRGKYLCGNS